jgi:copper transport outer membrane protein MctB
VVDFRYHALSLVAVFLALGIGIVLGVTVGDSLVSRADQNLRDSLRDDVTEARQEARDEQALGSRRDEVIDEASREVVDGRLRGISVGVIAIGDLPGSIADSIEEAIDTSGGDLERTVVFAPPDVPRARDERRQERLGRRLGRLFERGGLGVRALREDEPRRFSGNFAGTVDAVIVYRDPPAETDDDEAARDLELREAFEAGLVKGLRDNVIGVEAMDTDPSQVGWYEDQVIASVDNAELAAGRLALVLLIQQGVLADITGDRPEGSYGYKGTADAALPDLSD